MPSLTKPTEVVWFMLPDWMILEDHECWCGHKPAVIENKKTHVYYCRRCFNAVYRASLA